MQAFTIHDGIVAPLDRANVDTDAIIPKQYLKSIRRTGFGPHLFDDWRYLDAGGLDVDVATRRENPDFVLNTEPYRDASILLARENFGCGSSREHAVWALQQRLASRGRTLRADELLSLGPVGPAVVLSGIGRVTANFRTVLGEGQIVFALRPAS